MPTGFPVQPSNLIYVTPEEVAKFGLQKSRRLEAHRKWRYVNREKERLSLKKYKRNHPEVKARYERNRKKRDLAYRILCNMKTRMNNLMKGKTKSDNSLKLLGCSARELKAYLESKFTPEMTWDNYGAYWEVDHIAPCALFDLLDEDQQKKCFHYSNLQPLEKIKNQSKKDRQYIFSDAETGFSVNFAKGKDGSIVIQLRNSNKKGYMMELNKNGDVTEVINGNYFRIVTGNAVERTDGSYSHDVGHKIIMKGNEYLVLAADKIHLNPEEIKFQKELEIIPKEFKEN